MADVCTHKYGNELVAISEKFSHPSYGVQSAAVFMWLGNSSEVGATCWRAAAGKEKSWVHMGDASAGPSQNGTEEEQAELAEAAMATAHALMAGEAENLDLMYTFLGACCFVWRCASLSCWAWRLASCTSRLCPDFESALPTMDSLACLDSSERS